jgi:hypothetical protein
MRGASDASLIPTPCCAGQVKLEEESSAALQTINTQGHKALVLHARERDAYKVPSFACLLALRMSVPEMGLA